MDDRINGWDEIATYLRVHPRTAQTYERDRGLPIHRRKGGGAKPPVFAFRSELDKWKGVTSASSTTDAILEDQILQRVASISLARNLYRRDFLLRFRLESEGNKVFGRIAIEYDLVNGSGTRQPYTQEITIDDCERGYVEAMSVMVDGKPVYQLRNPPITEHCRGFVAYRGPTLQIEPSAKGKLYRGTARWVIKRNENDFWYLHAGIPTFGVNVETMAPAGFDITPSFSAPRLYLTSEHVDITWKRNAM